MCGLWSDQDHMMIEGNKKWYVNANSVIGKNVCTYFSKAYHFQFLLVSVKDLLNY